MPKINETGFWDAEDAHTAHFHSKPLSNWICEFLKDKKEQYIYDFGCGVVSYLKDLQNNGFKYLIGYKVTLQNNEYLNT